MAIEVEYEMELKAINTKRDDEIRTLANRVVRDFVKKWEKQKPTIKLTIRFDYEGNQPLGMLPQQFNSEGKQIDTWGNYSKGGRDLYVLSSALSDICLDSEVRPDPIESQVETPV